MGLQIYGKTEPSTTITVPLTIIRYAKKLIPKQFKNELQEKGIDIELVVELSQNKEIRGTIVEIENHEKNEKIVIAIAINHSKESWSRGPGFN